MKKELIICIVVIIIVVIVNAFSQKCTDESIDIISEKLGKLESELMKENPQKEVVNMEMEDIENEWKDRYNKLAYFIEHDELEKVETEITALKANIDIEENDEGVIEIRKAIFILNHIREKFKFNIKNIF